MTRTTLAAYFGSWGSAIAVATCASMVTMAATAGLSVLASDEVAAAGDVYGTRTFTHRAGGKRAIRAMLVAQARPPEPVLIGYMPSIALLANQAVWAVEPFASTTPSRPLHEAVEVPENFI